ncbi:MAG: Holliday junction branch migration protein RuvA [Pseudomonadota bacterium]
MIGRLLGQVIAVEEETLLIDVGGVGYEAFATARTLDRAEPGAEATYAVETVVREDFIKLYAFPSEGERKVFRILQTVQGVGAKAALAVLDVLSPADLADAVAAEDWASVARAKGVGKRIAERIVGELKSQLPALSLAAASGAAPPPPPKVAANGRDPKAAPPKVVASQSEETASARADAVSALANLGYEAGEARRAVAKAAAEAPDAPLPDLVKAALKELAAA